jgi:hypothetical protein
MSERKYIVPEGMLRAFERRWISLPQEPESFEQQRYASLLAALRWLSENPIIPTRAQVDHMVADGTWDGTWMAVEWQRRMFLSEPETETGFGEAWNTLTVEINRVGIRKATEILRGQRSTDSKVPVKDLLYDGRPDVWVHDESAKVNDRILESYKRGLGDKAAVRREAWQRVLDEFEALSKGEEIDSGIGVDVERVFYLALQRAQMKNDPRADIHREFHKQWTASVGTDGYNKEDWSRLDTLLNRIMYPNGGTREPEIPDEIKDLIPSIGTPHRDNWQDAVVEAYRRGLTKQEG